MFQPVNQSETVVDGVKKTRQTTRPAGPHEIEVLNHAALL